MTNAKEHTYRIPMLDASIIYKFNGLNSGISLFRKVKDTVKGNEKYQPNTAVFNGQLKYCYETCFLEETYMNTFEVKKFSSEAGGQNYTDAIVCVTFDIAYKEYNAFGRIEGYNGSGTLYIRNGYKYDDGYIVISAGDRFQIEDNICIADGSVIAIITGADTENSKLDNALVGSKYFGINADNQYTVIKPFKKIKGTKELREELYENGFSLSKGNGKQIEYVRYKRSAGMSRQGKCYFIRKELYKKMMKWSDFEPGKTQMAAELKKYGLTAAANPVSHEAYTALTLSSIEDKVEIDLRSILFVKDVVCSFPEEVYNVTSDENGNAKAEYSEVTVENIIWDGEALLDKSVFERAGRGGKGMMLLRNRYFKSCAFNTNLQEWFKEVKITDISQLNGFTLAGNIDDVKMIVTESSLKFLKMFDGEFENKIRYWIDRIKNDGGNVFGIVKSEKPTRYMGGKRVRTSYQLINTIGFNEEEAKELLAPVVDYKNKIRSDYKWMKHYLDEFSSASGDDENEDETGFNALNFKKDLVSDILDKYPDFAKTKMYVGFRTDIIKEINSAVRKGRLFPVGTNAVLFGNGIELIRYATDESYRPGRYLIIGEEVSTIYSPYFRKGQRIICARSPHITMGNVLVAENRMDSLYRFFNLTENIVCVNALGDNIQQKLNGCDYDSDVMLITDDNVLTKAAKRDYGKFPVPFNSLEFAPAENLSLADIDRVISENLIGEVVNLSQKLNTIYWTMKNVYQIHIPINADELYKDICILAVLSNTEIDKAKRIYAVDTEKTLKELREKYIKVYGRYFLEPEFWKSININEPGKRGKDYFKDVAASPMAYLYKESFNDRPGKYAKGLSFEEAFGLDYDSISVKPELTEKIIDIAEKTADSYNRAISAMNQNSRKKGRKSAVDTSVQIGAVSAELQNGIRKISKLCKSESIRLAVLREIDKSMKNQSEAKTVQWVLLAGIISQTEKMGNNKI